MFVCKLDSSRLSIVTESYLISHQQQKERERKSYACIHVSDWCDLVCKERLKEENTVALGWQICYDFIMGLGLNNVD